MVSVLASPRLDLGFEPRSGQTKNYRIGICCFSAKHAVLRRKSKDWLSRNQVYCVRVGRHVYQRTAVSVSYHYKNPTLSMLVQYKADLMIVSLKINLFSPWYSWKIAELVLNNNQPLNAFIGIIFPQREIWQYKIVTEIFRYYFLMFSVTSAEHNLLALGGMFQTIFK